MKLTDPKLLFIGGLIASIITFGLWKITHNTYAASALILVGSFTTPVAVMAFVNKHINIKDKLPNSVLLNCFMVGGAIGLIAAGFFEFNIPLSRTFSGYLGVGLIEESVKLIFPVALYLGWRYRRLSDGLLIGVASGMGFAVLETIGKGLIAFGDHANLGYIMLTRGFFTPFGHPAWTGLICAILWSERRRSGKTLTTMGFGVFVLAIVLHATWDSANRLDIPDIATAALLMLIGVFTMSLLFGQFEKAEKENADV